jgi:hypothetical protein
MKYLLDIDVDQYEYEKLIDALAAFAKENGIPKPALQVANVSGSVPYYKYWALNCISDIIHKYGADKDILAGFVNACLCRKEQEWLDKHIGTDR